MWACELCTCLNEEHAAECKACCTARSGASGRGAAAARVPAHASPKRPRGAAIDLTDTPSPSGGNSSAVATGGGGKGGGDLRGWIAAAKSGDARGSTKRQRRDDPTASDAALAAELQRREDPGAQRAARPSPRTSGAALHIDLQQPDSEGCRTDGLVELLKSQYRLPSGSWATRSTAAIAEVCPHFTQRGTAARQASDHQTCGFRNAQMLCAALLAGERGDVFRGALFGGSGVVPSVRSLQGWIERAWEQGWDAGGRAQFGGRLIDRESWIGTSEVWAMLRSFGTQPVVVDFKKRSDAEVGVQRLVEWIWRYFTSPDLPDRTGGWPQPVGSGGRTAAAFGSAAALRSTANLPQDAGGLRNHGLVGTGTARAAGMFRPPLFLQAAGHSRTVVGIERRVSGRAGKKVEWFLLVFDPLSLGTSLMRAFEKNCGADDGGGAAAAPAAAASVPKIIRCSKCDARAKRLVSRSENNPNRPYYSCPRDRDHFFKWEDQTPNGGRGGGGGGGKWDWETMVKRGLATLKTKRGESKDYAILFMLPEVITPDELMAIPDASKSYDDGPHEPVTWRSDS